MYNKDTIAAISTPIGKGGIGIIRISGDKVIKLSKSILKKIPIPRNAEYLSFYDRKNNILDKGIVLFFPSPKSFTGEDVLELHTHGSPIIMNLLLHNIISFHGIRIAKPGEFSERAFFNNKLDLIQAEGIEDLINSNNTQSAKAALNSINGNISNKINKLITLINECRVYYETIINFPDEENIYINNNIIINKINNIIKNINFIIKESSKNKFIRNGIKIVITGKPNAGKSSLLNLISNKDISIVTSIANTTRDVINSYINIDGIPLYIIDTAGICKSNNKIDIISMKKSWNIINKSDHILWVIDDSTYNDKNDSIDLDFKNKLLNTNIPITLIINKCDLTGRKIELKKNIHYTSITMSVKFKQGYTLFKKHIKSIISNKNFFSEDVWLTRKRHIYSLKSSIYHLNKIKKYLKNKQYLEIIAEELNIIQKLLNEITGKISSNEILDKIFSTFCIGK